MDFSYSAKEEAFRQEIRDWLSKNAKELPRWWFDRALKRPDLDAREFHDFGIRWHKKLYDAGFVGLNWPKEYGGRGATLLEQVVFSEEMAHARVPGPSNQIGIGWCGPTIIAFGTEEQKKRFLLPMLKADEIWCQGFSEPEAGSDLANCQTKGVEDGDYWVVNGQKVWTSGGHYSDWAILIVRTEPQAPKHRGLTFFLLDMHAPGVTVRPLRQMTGGAEFNETFMDNVRIHKSMQVGERGRGFYVAMGTLEFERSGIGAAIGRENQIKDMVQLAKETGKNKDPLVRQKLAQYFIEGNVVKYTGLRALSRQLHGLTPGPESMVMSAFGMEWNQRTSDFAMQMQGPYSRLIRDSKYAVDDGRWQYSFLRSRGNTIETGTSEIKRNVIAQRGLGLPRE
ncbi:MAG: acyl-CoA dehydrogenase family protein [Dehalococcoidia bacterium]|nr:acyl-CoA dehydrogenase family protein [Dehalococcoidia bacterium]